MQSATQVDQTSLPTRDSTLSKASQEEGQKATQEAVNKGMEAANKGTGLFGSMLKGAVVGLATGGSGWAGALNGATRYLTATAQHDVIAKPEFTGEDAQLWRIEQLTDGTYRIMPKAIPGTEEKLALVSLGDCTPFLYLRRPIP